MSLTLIIGSKNYSSWSLRPWMLLRHLKLEFDERVLTLDTPEFHEQIGKFNPARRAPQTPELVSNVRRIDEMWADCRRHFGRDGPWLFGEYSIADAMYAPVALRFNTYGAELSPASREYVNTALADPALVEWLRAAEAESHRVESIDAVG